MFLRSNKLIPSFCLLVYVLCVTVGAFIGGIWATFAIGGAVILWLVASKQDRIYLQTSRSLTLFALTTLAVWAAELPFSVNQALSLKLWFNLVTIFLPLLLLSAPRLQAKISSPSFTPIVASAMAVGAMALGAELLSGGFLIHTFKKADASLTEYNRGIAHVVILSFPIIAGLWLMDKKKQALLLALILLFPASLTESHTAKLALLLGALCTGIAFYQPVFVRRSLVVISVALIGWPFYAQRAFLAFPDAVARLHDSFRHRLEIWDFLSYRIAEKPILGWGLNTTHLLDYTQPHGDLYRFAIQHAPHAHNFIVELWVETGIPGLALGIIFLLSILRRIAKLHSSLQPFALGAFTAAVTVSLFGFDFWTDALWSAFALSSCAFGMLQQNIESGNNLIDA
jgi:O-antigen ligase